MNATPRHLPALALASLCLSLGACGLLGGPAADDDDAVIGASDEQADRFVMTMPPQGGSVGNVGAPSGPAMTASWQPGGTSPQAPQAPAAGQGMQRVPVIDHTGFEKPLPALWVQIPAGWKTEGGVVWNQQAPCGATPSFQWQALSPDGRQRLQMLQAEAWTWDNLGMDLPAGSCPRWPIMDVRAYLQSYVQRHRPGARVLDYRARNDLIRSPAPPSDAQTRFWKEGGEVLVSYSGPQGEVRESVMAVVLFRETTMAGVMPGEIRKFMGGIAGSPVIATAPSGQLDLAMASNFAMSGQTDPQWQARMDKHNNKIASDAMDGAIRRGEIIRRTGEEIADINQRGYEDRNRISDDMQRRTIDGINNVTRYRDPVTGQEVQLNNLYDQGYRAQDGTYFQSNDPNLNPYVDLGIDAEEMERIE